MSTSPPAVDPDSVEDVRQRIRRLAAEIGQLARMEDLGPEQFHAEFLKRVVAALAAPAGVVWTCENGRGLGPAAQVNLDQTGLGDDDAKQRPHGLLVQRCFTAGEPLLVPPHAGGENGQGGNPTDFLLVLAPLVSEKQPVGVVEVFQRGDSAPEARQGYLRFLTQMCDLAAEYFKGRQLRQLSERQELWGQLERFTRAIHKTLNSRKTAYTVANEGRQLIGVDRVSVALRRGRTCAVEAVSGQDVVDRRSNAVRLLADLAQAVVRLDEPLWFAGETLDLPPQLEDVLHRFVDETDVKLVGVLPLHAPREEPAKEEDGKENVPDRPLGALIVERIDDDRLPPGMAHRVEVVAAHSGAALANALHHEGLFLHGVWETIGHAKWLVRAKTLPKTLLAAGAVVALVLWLCLWPARLEMNAKGTLEPVLRRDVFTGIDGRVEEIRVEHGMRVDGPDPKAGRPGTLLVRLGNHELEEALAKVAGERLTVAQQMRSVERSLLEEDLTESQQNQASAQLTELRQKLANLQTQWGILQQKRAELAVHSPAEGLVITWDVEHLLEHRPVTRGQRLLQIADTQGPWRVELNVPENAMGHVTEAQGESEGPMPVSFVLATDPSTRYHGTIEEVHRRAEVREEEGSTVLVRVAIDPAEKERLRKYLMPGAGVSAKIDCGRCSVGYDLFHEIVAWCQRTWFRWM